MVGPYLRVACHSAASEAPCCWLPSPCHLQTRKEERAVQREAEPGEGVSRVTPHLKGPNRGEAPASVQPPPDPT
uniref:Uncharacterized protein n=1 Tax=Theropithecus gelada TaxID=9565 RepID=A0A8D2FAQ7_THEGE